MMRRIKRFLNRHKALIIIKAVLVRGKYFARTGSADTIEAVRDAVNYARHVVGDYLKYGRLGPEGLRDKIVLEVGPGNNLGVALLLLAKGARRVVCLDRFCCRKEDEREQNIYRELLKTLPPEEEALVRDAVKIQQEHINFDPQRIVYIGGVGIEKALGRLGREQFDLIVSRAVLQYASDPFRSFEVMERLLKTGGQMIHKIDLRDYGFFANKGFGPLEFLTVPDVFWNLIDPHAGWTNRCRADFYRRTMKRLGLEHRIYVTHRVGDKGDLRPHPPEDQCLFDQTEKQRLKEIRPRLAGRFQGLEDRDLLTSGIFLAARKQPADDEPCSQAEKGNT